MFTGLIEEMGRIRSVGRRGRMTDLVIEASAALDGIRPGDSIAVSGACLTVVAFDSTSFTVQAVEETLRRTKLGAAKAGMMVNLERSLKLDDRLGGHLVQGHVDGVGRIVSRRGDADNVVFGIAPDPSLERYIAEKGSITVDGVSLTVTYAKRGEFGVSIIPHTLKETTLEDARTGDTVNLETDVIARYVEKLLGGEKGMTLEQLAGLGF